MDLIESTFSGTSDRVEKKKEAQKGADVTSPSNAEDQKNAGKASAAGESVESTEANEKLVHISKEAPDSNFGPEKRVTDSHAAKISSSPGAENGDTPHRFPAVKAEKTPEFPLRPPVTPRKNVIPSRRTGIDNTTWAPSVPKRETLPADETPAPKFDRQPPTSAAPMFKTSQPLSQSEIGRDESNPPAHTDAPTYSAGAFTSNPLPEMPTVANLPTAYHDTSAAEEAWQAIDLDNGLAEQDTHILSIATQNWLEDEHVDQQPTAEIDQRTTAAAITTRKMATPVTPLPPALSTPIRPASFIDIPTTPMPVLAPIKQPERQTGQLTRKKALFLVVLLAIILLNASAAGFNQFFGPQGWGSAFNGSDNSGPNLLAQIAQQLAHTPTPGSKSTGTPAPPTPTQIANLLLSKMTLDEKLGQMMMVQFAGQNYSPDLDAMINQYHVGAVLYFQFNIGSKSQLTGLNSEMQHNAYLPLLVAVDQEGGTVDRLTNLDGAQPSATQIGATGNPEKAYQQGLKDAGDLASYGFNLNLAPVVDVNNVYNSQLYDRTYGNNPNTVSQFAEKYLEGLQHSGKVLGTLKHFPGLGDVSTDPHYGLPALTRSLSSLNSIDWAPYSNLIKQGNVYSIMVTHEIVDALDKTQPSSLSPKVIGILRNQMHFQGVIITDSLTMDSIHNFYTYGEAAAKAVEAGDDILMGADSPNTLAQMITGIKQAMDSGAITQQHIDDSVRRILLFKYEMGLLHV